MLKTRFSRLMLAGAIAGACVCTATDAALNIDIRATGVTGAGTLESAKSVIFVAPGSVVQFDVYALVTGTNANSNDDQFISVQGSLKSGVAGVASLRGDLAAGLVATTANPPVNGFDGAGSSIGLQQDLDGDGDVDVGSNINSDASNFWSAIYILAPSAAPAGQPLGRKIGFGTFTVTAVPPNPVGSSTVLNFRGGTMGVNAARYIQDGVLVEPGISSDGLLGITVRGPFPEPSSLAFAALGALALVRHRRD